MSFLENRKGSSSTSQEDVLDKKFKSCKDSKYCDVQI